MKLVKSILICIILYFSIGIMSGCGGKVNNSNSSEQAEQSDITKQTKEEKEKYTEYEKEIEEKETEEKETEEIETDKETKEIETDKEREVAEFVDKVDEMEADIITADYSDDFQHIKGCAVIYDTSLNTYYIYNEDECRTRVSPNSTFKVISTLMGLHNQVITSEESMMGYNGVSYKNKSWNSDLGLKEAFQSSCVWYFRKVIDEVGQETVSKELIALDYGNLDITNWNGNNTNSYPELNGFWLSSSLEISPIEQIEVLRNIMEGKTIYTESEVELLKDIMLIETNGPVNIYGKTGTGVDGNGWFIGFAQHDNTIQYFAVYLDDKTSNDVNGAKAKEIALRIINKH